MKRKVCENCKMFVREDECPNCKGSQFATNWQGRLHVLDATKSKISKKMDIKNPGEYAIKTR